MALTFGAVNTDRVSCGTGSSINDLDSFTCYLWIRPTTITSGKRIISKQGSGPTYQGWDFFIDTGGFIRFAKSRTTSYVSRVASSLALSTNTWYFVAFTFDSLGSAPLAKLFVGSLTTKVAETSYTGGSADGSGTYQSDASQPLCIGNSSTGTFQTSAFLGAIAVVGIVDDVLTVDQLAALQFKPRVIPNTKFFMQLGYVIPGTQPDWSGNANSGTITGATRADHVPIKI